MLKSITLKKFRKHEDLTVNFTGGLNALRGANEAGKSTLQEAILYALYGSKTLRTTLADTVTWGHKESELKVSLVFEHGGVDHTFERSKAGATIFVAGKPHVTGQNEVTAFAAEMLGADAKIAGMLMLATQADLRGSMDEGPTAVSALIARLADFDTVDKIVERANERLILGAEKPYADRLEEAKSLLAGLGEAPVLSGHDAAADKLLADATASEAMLRTELQPKIDAAQAELTKAEQHNTSIDLLQAQLPTLRQQALTALQRIETLNATIAGKPQDAELAKARADVEDSRKAGLRLKVYRAIGQLPAYPTDFWDADEASFRAELQDLNTRLAAVRAKASQIEGSITAANRRRITNGKCPTCGSTKTSDEHVAAHNAGVDQEVAGLRAELQAAQTTGQELAGDIAAMQKVEAAAKPFVAMVAQLANTDYPVNIDLKVYPPTVSWVGEPPAADRYDAAVTLTQLERKLEAATRAEGELVAVQQQSEGVAADILAVEARLAALERVNVEPLLAAVQAARSKQAEALGLVQGYRDQARALQQQHAAEVEAVRNHEARRTSLVERIEQTEKDLKALTFNNTLMKKLKGLKPAITDHLWSTVLSSVSTFFSQIRDEQSVVTKDAQGFKVNGHSIESLSGSTLDALAVATRVSLTKTFVPHVDFLALDEPAHGADQARTGNLLGFLASCGFKQVLLATHDPLSDSVAQNVILLGEPA